MTKTVLAVDDSRTMRDMVQLTLRSAGYAVIEAEDGAAGLEVLGRSSVDLIITDINMPRLDGFGLIEGVRANPAYRALPILVLTTESAPEKRARAKSAGATGWIVKPFEPQKLVDIVRRVAG